MAYDRVLIMEITQYKQLSAEDIYEYLKGAVFREDRPLSRGLSAKQVLDSLTERQHRIVRNFFGADESGILCDPVQVDYIMLDRDRAQDNKISGSLGVKDFLNEVYGYFYRAAAGFSAEVQLILGPDPVTHMREIRNLTLRCRSIDPKGVFADYFSDAEKKNIWNEICEEEESDYETVIRTLPLFREERSGVAKTLALAETLGHIEQL